MNWGGRLYSLTYGEVSIRRRAPIEIKPVYHYLPGSFAYSLGSVGCNFLCPGCQNWETAFARSEAFRGDLALIYFTGIDPSSGCLLGLDMTPMKIKNFRLSRAVRNDSLWLRDLLNRIGLEFGTRVQVNGENRLILLWD